MNDKLKNIFEDSDCPDRETLFSYMTGKLTPVAEHRVEMHLVDCAFCAEAIEAYREVRNLSMVNEQLLEIEEKIKRGDTGRRNRGFFSPQHFLKYAALLAFLLLSLTGLYFLLSDNKDQNLVMEAPVSRQAPTVQKQDGGRGAAPEPARAVKISGRSDQASGASSSDELTDSPAEENVMTESLDSYTGIAYADLKKETKQELRAATQKSQEASRRELLSAKSKDANKVALENEPPAASGITDTEISLNTTAKVPSNELETVSLDRKKSLSILDSAIRAYDNRYYIQTVNLLLNFSGKDKRESAKAEWYLASAYVQTREYEKARPILEKLSKGGSSFARKARKLLVSLD